MLERPPTSRGFHFIMLDLDISRDPFDLDRFRRCSTPPPDVIMKVEEDENKAITTLRQYLYRPPVRSPPTISSDSDEDLADSPVPRLLPSLVDDSGDEPMDVDEAPTPASSEPAFEIWNVSEGRAAAMPPPPVPPAKASREPVATRECESLAPPPRAAGAPSPPSTKRRLTFPPSPPRLGPRRPLGPRPLSVNTAKMNAEGTEESKSKKAKTKGKPHRLRSRSFTAPTPVPVPKEAPRGMPFSKRFTLNLRFEGRRTQTLLHLVGQHLARSEQFAQLATLMLVSRPTVPQLRPLLHRTVHLTRSNLGAFLRTFVEIRTPDPRRKLRKKAERRRVPGIKCIILHSVPEYAPWPAALLEETLTGAARLVVRCALPGPLMQRTVALLASPEQVCLDARALDGPGALSFALSVLPLWSELKELTIHNAGALQGSRLLSTLHERNITTPGEYRSQLTSMFEQKRAVYTLDFGEDASCDCDEDLREQPQKNGRPSHKLVSRDPWDRFFGALNLVDAISVNVVVPHTARRTLPGPDGANPVKYAMRAKRRGWAFGRIEDIKVRCACGQNVARRVDLP